MVGPIYYGSIPQRACPDGWRLPTAWEVINLIQSITGSYPVVFTRLIESGAGTGFLTWDYDELNKDDDKWLYLPAIKKTRRISGSSAKQDYFMGSDFTYDDMGSRNVDEDTHTLLGEETVDGQKCWKLESLPKDKRDIYSRKTALIRQDCLIPVRVEYYDKMGKLHRRLEMSDIAKVEGFWVARKMHMTNVQTEHQTVLEIKNPTYNIPMEESKFNVTTLEKGRF